MSVFVVRADINNGQAVRWLRSLCGADHDAARWAPFPEQAIHFEAATQATEAAHRVGNLTVEECSCFFCRMRML